MNSTSRVLIVDDDASASAALQLILTAGAFDEITLAANADDAFGVLNLADDDPEIPPAVDVIVLDIVMPGLDGIEACARIRKTRRYRDVPIVMCSGVDDVTSLNQAFIAGAHDYVAKPVRKIELLSRLRAAMRFKREIDRRRAREAMLRSKQPDERASGQSLIDDNTNLPNQHGFEVAVLNAIARERPYGLLALQIADAAAFRMELGNKAADELTATVATAIGRISSPLDWNVYYFGEGLFLVLAPDGAADQLDALAIHAETAIAAMRISHGHSVEDDFVRLASATAQASGSELLTAPAELIRRLEVAGRKPDPDRQTGGSALRKATSALAFLIPLLLPLGASTAHAAAWTQPAGEGQAIVTGVYSHSDKGFDANGQEVDIDDYTKAEAFLLLEYGITDDLTVMATPSFSHVEVENGDDSTGLGYTELGARYRLAQSDGGVLSLQASLRLPGKTRRDNNAQIGATDSEIDVRALAGTGFTLGGADGFVDLQAGYRFRTGGPPNEYRLDATVGIRPDEKVLLLGQSFNVVSDGSGSGVFGKHRYSNLYVSGVYDIDRKWSVQVGALGTLSGRNALRERGLLAAVWRRF